MAEIRIAVIGVGNCASALIQGIHYYRRYTPDDAVGLMHYRLGGYAPEDIHVTAAFDIDARKVGRDVAEAIFAPPNCTRRFCPAVPETGVAVSMGAILDGVSPHLADYPAHQRFEPAANPEPGRDEVVRILKETKTDIMVNYLPVGSGKATQFYADCALEAGCGFANCIPVFIASDPEWAARFSERNLPIVGDDIKSQLGATITHRQLADLFRKRGVKLERTYQLNTGGNTDFLNMLNRERLASKKTSKTEAVQSVLDERLPDDNIHVGPSDYVPWQKDNKVAFIRMEGRLFGDVPMNLELRLSVEDSPNSAGVAIDAIRCAKLALMHGEGGVLEAPSAWFCKHPPRQFSDDEAWRRLEVFIRDRTAI
ncbi:MAG: inositol-3-phosphate synthase [Gammaproteobacteria bacterium]|nr:inositol-3-phosphate synthase [Gammaproteobacteria bacterium]